jgi:hypothetical protein
MMKVFKPIYYSSLAILIVLFLIFTAVDFCGVNAKGYIDTAKAYNHVKNILDEAPTRDIYLDNEYHQRAIDYITDTALGADLGLIEINTYANAEGQALTSGAVSKAAYSVMDTTLNSQEINDWYAEQAIQDRFIATAEVKLTNIIVYIPSKDEVGKDVSELDSDTIMYISHYDSKSYTPSVNNLAIIGAMLESVRELKDINDNTNSLLFVFADGGEYNALGAYAFREKYKGFNDVYSRVKAAFAFDSLGSGGALTLIQTNQNASKLASKWAQVNKKAFAASVGQAFGLFEDRIFDYNIFQDKPALNFANIDNSTTENMAIDGLDNLNSKLLSQTGAVIVRAANSLASYDLNKLLKGSQSINFSYLGGIVSYSDIASYVLASLLLVLAGVVFVINQKKKSFSILDALKGSIVQILAILVTFVLSIGVYYAVGGLLAAMGFLNIHSLATYLRSSIGLIISFSFISVALSIAAFSLLKRLFKIRAADAVRGNIIIWTIISVILGYAIPKLAYVFMFTAFLELIAVLVMIFIRDKFRQKYHMDFERILLFIVPLILTIPITFGASLVLYQTMGFYMYPTIIIFTVSTHGFITPYFNYLAPWLDRLAKKLPMRTVRIERAVTEKIEHKAKKGKFEERTVKKIFKEKRPRVYKNYFGISVITLIGLVLLFVFSMTGRDYGYNYAGAQNQDYLTKNSIVYLKDINNSYWIIEDLDMFNYLYFDLSGYKWDAGMRAYKKTVSSSSSDFSRGNELAKLTNISASTEDKSKTFTVSYPNIQNNTKFYYDLELTNAKTISKIKITTTDNRGQRVTQEIDVSTAKPNLVIQNLKGQSTITVTGRDSVYSGTINLTAQVSSYQNPNLITDFHGFSEWEDLKNAASEKGVDINVILKIKSSQVI